MVAWFNHGRLGLCGTNDTVVFLGFSFGVKWFRWVSSTDKDVSASSGSSTSSLLFSGIGIVVIWAARLSAGWTRSAGFLHLNWGGIWVMAVWTVSLGACSALEAGVLLSLGSLLLLLNFHAVVAVPAFRVSAVSSLEAWLLWWSAGTNIWVMSIWALTVCAFVAFEAWLLSGFSLFVSSETLSLLIVLIVSWWAKSSWSWWRETSILWHFIMKVAAGLLSGTVWTISALFSTLGWASVSIWTSASLVSWVSSSLRVSELAVFLHALLTVFARVFWKGLLG